MTIADISPDVLHGPYDQALRDELRRQLDLLGVELRLGSPLREVPAVPPATPASIELTTESGEELNADIWYRCFGVIPQTEYLRGGLAAARDDAGYVRVDEHLRVAGQERIFALGDISDADRDMAGVATAQAQVVAGNVRALSAGTELTAYERYPTAIAVPLGPEGGAGQLPGLDGIAGPDVIADNKGRAMLLDRYAASFDLARGPEAAAESLSAAAEFGKDIVIAFDGSENARHAIRVAARELGGGRAAVLHVWVPLVSGPPRVATSALSARAGSVTHHVTQHPRVPVLAVPQERRE